MTYCRMNISLLCCILYLFLNRNDNVNRCSIESLYVRNYPKVTDAFLKTAVRTCPYLKSLDITGSCCTLTEIEYYRANRPNTDVIW